jgi:multiple sugar transport system permease protein
VRRPPPTAAARRRRRTRLLRGLGRLAGLHFPVLAIVLFAIAPYIWTFLTSITPERDLNIEVRYFPRHPTTENYARLFANIHFGRNVRDSLLVASGTTVLGLSLTLTASYSFSRFKFRFRDPLLVQFLVINMFPVVLLLIPLFIIMRTLHLMDTHLALIVAYSTFTIPFSTWMMTSFFRAIPRELDESAQIDGLGRIGTMLRIVIPVAAPGIAATAIYIFITAWNEFIYAAVFTTSAVRTIPVALQNMVGEYQITWGLLTSGGVLAALPVIVLFFFVQKQLIGGMTAGAVKG